MHAPRRVPVGTSVLYAYMYALDPGGRRVARSSLSRAPGLGLDGFPPSIQVDSVGSSVNSTPDQLTGISMVKSVIADSSIEAAFQSRAAAAATTATVEWGFLVGQAGTSTHSKEYVLATVPATESEGITRDDLVDQAVQVWIVSKRPRTVTAQNGNHRCFSS